MILLKELINFLMLIVKNVCSRFVINNGVLISILIIVMKIYGFFIVCGLWLEII